MLNMDGEEEPPPPSDKALAKLEDKVNEMGEMILEIASQVENLTPAGAEGNQEGLEQLSSQVSDLVGELRLMSGEINTARNESILRDAGCETPNPRNVNQPGAGNGWSFCGPEEVFVGGDFRFANLSRVDLRNAHLQYADFWAANLTGSNFSGADIGGSSFSEADLTGADFTGARFQTNDARNQGTSFREANLTGADFTGALDLDAANFAGAILTDVIGLP
jgi:uncharacterized protein YjbI with pentapeptide repeats